MPRWPCSSMPAPNASKPSTDREAVTDTSVSQASSGRAGAVTTPSRSAHRPAKPRAPEPRTSAGPGTGVRAAANTPASSIISAAATPSSHTRPSSSASRPSVTGWSERTASRSSRGSGRRRASSPVARPSHGTSRPIGTPSHTPFGAPSSAAPAMRRGWSSPAAAYAAAASPAATATSSTVTTAETAGRTTRCTASQPRGSGVRREASRAMTRIPADQPSPPSSVGAVSTVNPTAARASTRSPIRSGSNPPMSPNPGISRPSPPPPPVRSSRPSAPPSIVMTSCPAQASPPSIATNSATTAPARARSSAGDITTPAARKDRRKKYDSSTAPTRLTPSGVISMAVSASAPVRPNADTSPDGVTEPPAPRATTAAVIGPNEPAVSASSSRRPSAAVPAIPINAQLTAATADISTSPHGTRAPLLAVSASVPAPMADPPIRYAAGTPRLSPSRRNTTLRSVFNPVNGNG
ncbi:hypothetical protein STAFG_3365 [Streptomyces afghaniensis 772]|uniref:Uncharacterized protein n=1 Tax=Streptomyces afghaniensis 772 TaxID=1283301 RepID=S4MV34_9ACTN|nr:hypothetical protein STAFG_3365 [Streptomyces afghaniensis 772]